jgi:peptidyl-prolyl cis-trans isomerase C
MPKAIVRRILVKDRVLCEQLRTRIAKGEDFAKLAKQFLTCSSAKRGGELGEISQGQLVRPIDNVVINKPEHVVHGPVKSQFGFHLVEVKFRY